MYKLGRSVGNTISLGVFITSTTLKTFKLVLFYTKNVKEKYRKKFLIFVLFTLAWILYQHNRCFVLLLDSSTCLGFMNSKANKNNKKERDYLKNKLFSKVPIISGMCGEKDLIGKEKSLRKKKRAAVLKKKFLIPHVKVILILFLKNMSHLKLYILMLLLMMKYLPSIISQIVKQI